MTQMRLFAQLNSWHGIPQITNKSHCASEHYRANAYAVHEWMNECTWDQVLKAIFSIYIQSGSISTECLLRLVVLDDETGCTPCCFDTLDLTDKPTNRHIDGEACSFFVCYLSRYRKWRWMPENNRCSSNLDLIIVIEKRRINTSNEKWLGVKKSKWAKPSQYKFSNNVSDWMVQSFQLCNFYEIRTNRMFHSLFQYVRMYVCWP